MNINFGICEYGKTDSRNCKICTLSTHILITFVDEIFQMHRRPEPQFDIIKIARQHDLKSHKKMIMLSYMYMLFTYNQTMI